MPTPAAIREAHLRRLVRSTYEGAWRPERWSSLGAEMAQCFGGNSAVVRLALPDPAAGVLTATDNLQFGKHQVDWARHWLANDLWAERGAGLSMGQVVHCQSLVSTDTLERTGFYQDWLRHLDIHDCMGCVLELSDGPPLVVGVHRPRGTRAFDAAELRDLGHWVSHLQQAVHLQRWTGVLRHQQRSIEQVADASPEAQWLLDASARPIHANSAATNALRDRSHVKLVDGRVQFRQVENNRLLAELLSQASVGKPVKQRVFRLTGSSGERVVACVVPLTGSPVQSSVQSSAVALLRLREPAKMRVEAALLKECLGLTRTEAHIVADLANGLSPEETATARGMQPSTVKTHLRNVYVKTGVNRQVELVALALRLCIAL